MEFESMRNIKHRIRGLKIIVISAAIVLGVAVIFNLSPNSQKVVASASGPAPTHTGAPGEANCTACHASFPVNSGSGNVTISGFPKNYLPGQEIPLTVTVNQSDGVLFGFQMTTLNPDGESTGTYTIPAAAPPVLQLDEGFVGVNERQYIEHTINGITPTQFGTKSWQFTWTAPSRRVGKVGFYAAGNAADSNGGTSGDFIYTTSGATLSGSAVSSFDSDGSSDFAVFRPSDGIWYSINSSNEAVQYVKWGIAGDKIVPGDYDGDGRSDHAVYRPSEGMWYLAQSTAGVAIFPFGLADDIPVPGDYDGDLRTDVAVFRPSEGNWYVGTSSTGGYSVFHWGLSGDKPVPGDYDGDAKTDTAVYRPSEGRWYVQQSSDGLAYYQFGLPTDQPVQGDYDGDGRHDVAVYRPSSGQWWILGSSAGASVSHFGLAEDIPAPGDYDGDGKSDITLFRPSTGIWYSVFSGDQSFHILKWGLAGDMPVATAYITH
jgi:hypothetical protein